MSAGKNIRFEALDALRGLCAIWVAVHHFRVVSHLQDTRFVLSGSLGVDFFFALSGFVIFHAYGRSLETGPSRTRFVIRRFGRLYPLHLVTLLALVLMETVRWGAGLALSRPIGGPAFSGSTDLASLPANLLLVHGLGFLPDLTWNVPSWSISVEFAVCIIFMLCSMTARPVLLSAILAVIAGTLYAWIELVLPVRAETAPLLVRGVYGFSLGVLAYAAFDWCRKRDWTPPAWLELSVVAIVPIAVLTHRTPLPTLLFSALVFILAFEKGLLSRALRFRRMIYVGEVSYSIYLVHYLFVLVAFGAAAAVGAMVETDNTVVIDLGSKWLGDLATVLFVALTVLAAGFTYRWIEIPGRSLFNRLSDRWRVRSEATNDGAGAN